MRRSGVGRVVVRGRSMEPTLRDGDDILVDRDATAVRSGAIYVLRVDDMLVVKRLIGEAGDRLPFVIRSDNAAYPEIIAEDPGSVQVIGRVLWCGRRMA